MPADTDTDHSIRCAEITTSAQTDGIGEQRPRGQPLHEWEDAQYKQYNEHMEAWQKGEGKSDMDSKTHEASSTDECIRTIEEMQQAMTIAVKKLDENRRHTKPQEERGPNDSSKEKQPDKTATQGTATSDTTEKKKGHENQRAINHPIPNDSSSTCEEITDTDTNKTPNEAARPRTRSLREPLRREIGRWTHLQYEAQHHYDGHDKHKEGRTNVQQRAWRELHGCKNAHGESYTAAKN